jgi:hypothetical protein
VGKGTLNIKVVDPSQGVIWQETLLESVET